MHLVSDTGGSNDGTNREAASDSSDTEAGTFDTTRTLSLTTAWDESHTWVTSDPGTFTVPLTLTRPSPRPRLEVVEDNLPILAHRAAALRFGGDSRHWASLNESPFGADEDAICTAAYSAWGRPEDAPTHPVPSEDCTCGFYACPLGVDNTYANPYNVTLLVELSGDVIECEKLYRAGHQRVIECQLPLCPYCTREATLLRARHQRLAAVACSERHLERGKGVILTVDDFAELVQVPVTSRAYK